MESRFTNNNYRPEIGNNVSGGASRRFTYTHYANLRVLTDDLEKLISEMNSLEAYLEEDLDRSALKLNLEDNKLIEAHKSEWPTEAGQPVDQISYRYYKALRLRDTTAAAYIRKRYEEAARDVTGSTAIDFLSLASIIKNEALLIQEFLNVRVGLVDDSSEHRVLELFQDWVQSGLRYAREFRTFLESRSKAEKLLPEEEIRRATPEEAKQGQAVFKVKLNTHNDTIVKDTEFLRKNFSEFAPVFYNKFLGPALTYRLNVGRRPKVSGSMLSEEIEEASKVLDTHMRHAMADQLRRGELFQNKVDSIFENIQIRDVYRAYIQELSPVGRTIRANGDRVMVPTQEGAALEVERWITEGDPEGSFVASHSDLVDRDDPQAHDQYLLRAGGTIIGDVDLTPGTTIGGIIPGEHRHTGADGSARIHGKDIIEGSIGDDVIDITDRPPVPENLRVLGYKNTVVPPGVSTVDASIAWDGDIKYTYEVQKVHF